MLLDSQLEDIFRLLEPVRDAATALMLYNHDPEYYGLSTTGDTRHLHLTIRTGLQESEIRVKAILRRQQRVRRTLGTDPKNLLRDGTESIWSAIQRDISDGDIRTMTCHTSAGLPLYNVSIWVTVPSQTGSPINEMAQVFTLQEMRKAFQEGRLIDGYYKKAEEHWVPSAMVSAGGKPKRLPLTLADIFVKI